MTHIADDPTWDDVLDDFEDLIDETLDALDAGRPLETSTETEIRIPAAEPASHHMERFARLQAEATEASVHLRAALTTNTELRAADRDRLQARRTYSGTG